MMRAMTDGLEPGPFRLVDSVSHLLHRAEQLAGDRFTKLVDEAVTLRQFAVLAAIAQAQGLSQSDLVRATGIDRSTLADMISRMQRRGWIDRTTSLLDARAHAVSLASAGEAVLLSATQHARAADAAILDALPGAKRKAFLGTLTKLARFADEAAAQVARETRREVKRQERRKQRAKERTHARAKAERDAARKNRA